MPCPHPKGSIRPLEDKDVKGEFRYYCLDCGVHLTFTEALAITGSAELNPPPEAGLKGKLL